ncbi:hypothetical protein DL93DRAFT_2082062 [Clavulina sp. PMI_390]|nr:hypothetical protein DL93DRAFT_2082062 [Clavulina sp. PMI_390]
MGNSESLLSHVQKTSPFLTTPLEPRVAPIGLSSAHVYQEQVLMRYWRQTVVLLSEHPSEKKPEVGEKLSSGTDGEGKNPGVVYELETLSDKGTYVRKIIDPKGGRVLTLRPAEGAKKYTLHHDLPNSVEPIGVAECTGFTPKAAAHVAFNNFGDPDQPVKLMLLL